MPLRTSLLIPRILTDGIVGARIRNTGSTTENTVKSFVLPANTLGPKGFLRIDHSWTCATLNTNTKIAKVKFGGQTVFSVSMTTASHVTHQAVTLIQNREVTNSQISTIAGSSGNGVIAAGSLVTMAVDTTQDVIIDFTAQCSGSAADILDLERVITQVCYVP